MLLSFNSSKRFILSLLSFSNTINASVELLNENFIIIGDFNAISIYNNDSTTLTNISNSINLYELSKFNDSISLLDTFPNSTAIPSLWYPLDDENTIMIIHNKPYIYNLNNLDMNELTNWNLDDNLNTSINSIYYDVENSMIYFGGSLKFNQTFGVVQYDYVNEQLLSLPFGGFNEGSIVNSILKYNDTNSIIFSGLFNSIGYYDLLNVTYNETFTNYTTIKNKTSDGIVNISQKIPIQSSKVSATAGENYENIICPTTGQNGWKLPNNEIGSWSATLDRDAIPSKIRLYNSLSNSNGAKSFRVITYPANGIMNMSYIDPTDLTIKNCDAFCPLHLPSTIDSSFADNDITDDEYYTFTNDNQTVLQLSNSFQDFSFVNSITVTSFTVQILDYYGDYSELLGIELSSIGITAFANNDLNQPDSCDTSTNDYDIEVSSSSLGGLDWETDSNNNLYSNVSFDDISSDKGIRYEINIPVSGQYSILMYTNGCLQDNSCESRGIVNVTVTGSDGEELSSTIIYQTNQYQKYDVLYTGSLKLNPSSPIVIDMTLLRSINNENIYVVAESIQLQYIQLELDEITGNITNTYNEENFGMIEINGIFEYSLTNFSNNEIEYPIGNTTVNLVGSEILSDDALINNMIINETSLIIAGEFSSIYGNGILGLDIVKSRNYLNQIKLNQLFTIDGGLSNGEITDIYGPTDEFLMIGSFGKFNNDSDSFNNGAAIFNTNQNDVESVNNISNSDAVGSLSGFIFNSTEYLVITYNDDNTTDIFDFTNNSKFENSTTFSMNILSSLDDSNDNWMLDSDFVNSYVIGSIVKFDLKSNNIVKINNDSTLSSIENDNDNQFISGVYINNNTIAVADSNIYLLSNDSTSLLSSDLSFSENNQINSLLYYKSNLIFGVSDGSDARFKSNSINSGLTFYDMNSSSLKALNETFEGSILDMTVDPEFGTIIGVGSFSVGDCKTICTFGNNSEIITVNRSVSDIDGSISSANYYNEYKVLIGGNFSTDNKYGYLGVYDTYNNSVSILDNLNSQISNPVSKILFGDERKNNKTLNDLIIIMGNDYVGYFNQSQWNSISNGLDLEDAQLTDISLIDSSSDSFYNSQVLLLTGNFKIDDFGTVSSAIWNGSKWIPYTIVANNLQVNEAKAQSVVRMTSMFIYEGTFTSTVSSSTSTSSSSSSTATAFVNKQSNNEFTNGEVAGVGCALAIGTLMILTGIGFLYVTFAGSKEETLEGLKLTGEDRMFHGQQMMDAVVRSSVPNSAAKEIA